MWAFVLFYLHLAGFFALFGWTLKYALDHNLLKNFALFSSAHGGSGIAFNKFDVGWPLGMLALTLLICVGIFALFNYQPKGSIIFAFWCNIVLTICLGILLLLQGYFWAIFSGVCMIIIAIVMAVMYFMWRRYIPLSAEILKTVTSVIRKYPAVIGIALFSGVITSIYSALFVLTGGFLQRIYTKDEIGDGAFYALSFFGILSFYWTTQVAINVVHTITAGVMATYYFVSGSGYTVKSPTLAAAKRTFSYSFGSVAFGSLLVALIQTLRHVLRSASDPRSVSGAIVDCLLGIVEQLAEYFNYYAYIYVAIYGKSYLDSAHSTWIMIKSRGIDAIINDNLVETTVRMFCFFTALLTTGLTAFVYLVFKSSQDPILVTIECILVFAISLAISILVLDVISSASSTTFVCLAEDPAALKRTKPELYSKFEQTYPRVFVTLYA